MLCAYCSFINIVVPFLGLDARDSVVHKWAGANRASRDVILRIMRWSCIYSPRLKVIESQVFGSQIVRPGFFIFLL